MMNPEKGITFEFFPGIKVDYPMYCFERKPINIPFGSLLKKRALQLKLAVLPVLSVFLLLMSTACEPNIEKEIIPDEYCSFYRSDYTTIDIELEYQSIDNKLPIQKALIRLYNFSPGGQLIINDLNGGEILINGYGTEYKEIAGEKGFYPVTGYFSLSPGSLCEVLFKHENQTYLFTTQIPNSFDDVIIPDTLNMANDFRLKWNNDYDSYVTTIFLKVYNPTNPYDYMVLIDEEMTGNNEVQVPFNLLAPTINGWTAILYMVRTHEGICDPAFLKDSSIRGTCSYYKEFALTYSKSE
jgi:hypothetical protein